MRRWRRLSPTRYLLVWQPAYRRAVSSSQLTAHVCPQGGLGIITALTQPTPEDLRAEIRKCRALLDDPELPFGVNVTLLPALVPTDPEPILRVIIEEGVKVVETAGRSPEALIPPLHEAGITIVHKCVAVRHAMTAERLGCDAISMDGFECGGHPGEEDIGNFVLQAIAARKLNVPFVCSVGQPSVVHLPV
jgi:NADH:quinone reductase (non-electrogenic)